MADDIDFLPEEEVVVFMGGEDGLAQPDTFQFCPLGIQFYARDPIPECTLIGLTLSLPAAQGEESTEVECTGVVAQCCEASQKAGMHRIWVKFMDIDETTVERIRHLTTSRRFVCPFCANF